MRRKFFYILLILVPLILNAVGSVAMPPHPDLLKKWREEGTLEKNIKRVASSKVITRTVAGAMKSTPSTGTVRIPVVLVAYRNAYSADMPAPVADNNPWDNSRSLLIVIFLITGALAVSMRGARFQRRLKPAIPLYILILASFLSCGETVTGGYTEREFPTATSVYTDLLNGQTTSSMSVKKFYSDMSNSNLQLQFDVYGPVTVSEAWSYYGSNDLEGNDLHPGELAAEAVRLVIRKYPGVDFSVYDNNNDDLIDTVIIIHEGPGEEVGAQPETIWSHQWDLYSANYFGDGAGPAYVDGVWFNSYAMVPEYSTTRGDSSVGVFAHEFGHALGLPDLYDTTYETNGVGNWSLMASGSWGSDGSGNDPAPLLAWERNRAGGSNWVTITTLSSGGSQSINNIESTHAVFKIMLDNASGEEQYLLLEGKTGISGSDWYVPGSVQGILVTHIHEGVVTEFSAANTINADSSRIHGVNVVEADSGNDLWDPSPVTGDAGTVGDLYTTGGSIIDALMYTDNTTYSLSTANTTDDITAINTGTTPMTFNYAP